MALDLSDLIKQIEPVTRSAGQVIMGYFRRDFQQREKSLGDFVTEADLASQEILIVGLSKLLPQAQIISEELAPGLNTEVAEYCWIIDPLDGTNNFRRGIPHFAISVALTKHKKTILGVVYDPVHQDFFYAVLGQGLYYNHKQVTNRLVNFNNLGNLSNFHNCLITTNIREIYLLKLELEGAILRKFGGAALDLAYVAMGWIDLVAYEGLYQWDWAAGELLVSEAQKKFNQVQISGSWGGGQQILAGSEPLVTEMCRYIN